MSINLSQLKDNQNGVIHHLGLIILFVVVLAGVGGAGYYVYQSNQGESINVVAEESIVNEEDDADGEVLPQDETAQDEPTDTEGENSAEAGS